MPVAISIAPAPVQVQYTNPKGGSLKLRGNHVSPSTSAFPELDTQGYTVVKGVIPEDKAAEYVSRMYAWMESFGLGFKRDDRSTWKTANVPNFAKGGLYNRHGAGQEQFAWDIRSEPALIDTFAKIWNTDELLVSIDGINVSLPLPASERSGDPFAPWPHVDQSPNRRFKHCVQGIMNLHPNGPDDGGLMVLEGSLPLYNEFFEAHEQDAPEGGWDWKDSYHHKAHQLEWFYERGCTWKKVEAGPGDVILWDSRCIHYGAPATGDRPRIATYVCYKPAQDIEPDMIATRKEAMDGLYLTSHDPLLFRLTGSKVFGKDTEYEREEPLERPILSERAQQLAGIRAY